MSKGRGKRVSVCLLSLANVLAVVIWPGFLVVAGGFAAGIVWWVPIVILLGLPLGVAALVCADRVPRQPVMVVANTLGLLFQGGFWSWYLYVILRS
jgi:hypothetical protein